MPNSFSSLGDLSDPTKYTEALVIDDVESDLLIDQLRMILLIRKAEEKIGDMVVAGKIHCPCHLGIGQEAIAVGVSANLRKTDRLFGAHRSHTHYLAQGGSLFGLFAETLGRASGCSLGMGGSMHLYDGANGFMGSVPIVAGTVSLAVGAALAEQKSGKGNVGVSYFGDGAAEEGSVHESLNFAAVFKLPMLFVCENNFFSSHLHIDLRQPANSVARYAAAHSVNFRVVDGNDVVAVSKAAKELVEGARRGDGPGFLETITYRWRGHVGPREDQDVGVMRKENLDHWKRRDPARRLVDALRTSGALTADALVQMNKELDALMDRTWEEAEKAPFPPASATLDMVYDRL